MATAAGTIKPGVLFPAERKGSGTKLSQTLRGHQISLDYRVHLGCSGAKSDDHALDHAARTATLG